MRYLIVLLTLFFIGCQHKHDPFKRFFEYKSSDGWIPIAFAEYQMSQTNHIYRYTFSNINSGKKEYVLFDNNLINEYMKDPGNYLLDGRIMYRTGSIIDILSNSLPSNRIEYIRKLK